MIDEIHCKFYKYMLTGKDHTYESWLNSNNIIPIEDKGDDIEKIYTENPEGKK